MLPIIITIPFGDSKDVNDSAERRAYEEKLIDAFLQDNIVEEDEKFYNSWYFYPYRNPNPRGQSLTPSQLFDVLSEEVDLFLPEINTVDQFQNYFPQQHYSHLEKKFRQPFVPPHNDKRSGEVIVSEGQERRWDTERIVLVADDLSCRSIKLFQVEVYEFYWYKKKELLQAGFTFTDDKEEIPSWLNNERDYEDEDGEDLYPDTYGIAARWLNFTSRRECMHNGISAGYVPTEMATIDVINLKIGNMDLEEMMTELHEVDEEGMERMIQSLKI